MPYGGFRRLYLTRAPFALFLCLPGVFLAMWYAWGAFDRFEQCRGSSGENIPFTLEQFHLQLFDLLRRDLRRLTLDPPPESSSLEHLVLHLDSENLALLHKGHGSQNDRATALAKFAPEEYVKGEGLIPVKLRLQGKQAWNVQGQQKSMTVKLPKGRLHNGHRMFDLINDPMPMVVGEQLVHDLAREQGVLVPYSDFVRLRMNLTDLGVFRYKARADESLLRRYDRIPGDIYSGRRSPSGQNAKGWLDDSGWQKKAWRNGSVEQKKERSNLRRLLFEVNRASLEEFNHFAVQEIDLQPFARLESLAMAFPGDHDGAGENDALYFDSYRGRWEPVARQLKGVTRINRTAPASNPLQLRLKLLPGYMDFCNRLLYDFLQTEGQPEAIRERGLGLFKRLAPELMTDPFWDGYQLLVNQEPFYQKMLRPMDLQRALLVFESGLMAYGKRHAALLAELEKNPLYLQIGERGPSTEIKLVVDGQVGVDLTGFHVLMDETCTDRHFQVFKGGQPISPVAEGEWVALYAEETLRPAVSLIGVDSSSKDQRFSTVMQAEIYPFTIRSSCRPVRIEAEARHGASHSRLRSQSSSHLPVLGADQLKLQPSDVPKLISGEVSAHPWSYSIAPPETLTLGPGMFEIPVTRIFTENQQVEIAANTHIRMGADASLIFLGPVRFNGTRTQPITITAKDKEPWGAVILQGQQTAGSLLSHLQVRGGTFDRWRGISYPAMVNIHDSQNVTLQSCRFEDNNGQGDLVHMAYVKGVLFEYSRLKDASLDGLDLEFCTGILRGLEISGSGDEGLDIMGSDLELVDSIIRHSRGNGVSAGEKSVVKIRHSLIAESRTGVLVKNAAHVKFYGSMLFQNDTGLETYKKTVRYAGESTVSADLLYVVGSREKAIQRQDRKRNVLDAGRVFTQMPKAGALNYLATNVLRLKGWDEFSAGLNSPGQGEVR